MSADIKEVKIPHSGSVENVEVNEWLVDLGATVEEDESIADISTDKVDTELVAPRAGRIIDFLVDAGAEVAVGTVVALMVDVDVDDEAAASALEAYRSARA
jgi:pyruvate/2-oxoglutarate dehydrogenase complex dihydrolipoamide acyltransferase (E2) component